MSANKIILSLCIVIFFSSCISNKKINYLQNSQGNSLDNLASGYNRFEYRLQIDDIILVNVRSNDAKATAIFNNSSSLGNQNIGFSDLSLYYNGYAVDDSGHVELPVVGKIKVLGLTLKEAKSSIEDAINQYFINSYITVKLNGIRYAILGEVKRPGKYSIYENQVTIFEALSQGGDLTTLADRNKVILLRHYPEGARKHEINLLDFDVVHSPYYFVQTNDVIYVPPLKVREVGTGITGFQTFQAVVTVLSFSLLMINLLNSYKK